MWSLSLTAILELIRERTSWAPTATTKDTSPNTGASDDCWKPSAPSASAGETDPTVLSNLPNTTASLLAQHAHDGRVSIEKVQEYLDRLSRRYEKLMQDRDELLEVQIQEQIEWAKCANMRRLYAESQQQFMGQAEVLLSTRDPAGEIERLRHLYRQTQADLNAMNAQAEITKNLEDRFSSIHFHLQRRDKAFIQGCHAMASLWQLPSASRRGKAVPVIHTFSSIDSRASQISEGNALHPILESYYDKAGDVGLIGEELANLDIEYEETRGSRLLIAERGDSLSMSNSKFEENYRHAREQIEQRLSVAVKEVNELKQRCIDEGIDLIEREKTESESADDLLVDRSSEVLDFDDVRSHHAPFDSQSNWRMSGRDYIFRGGPVFRHTHESLGSDIGSYGSGSPRAPDLGQNDHVLHWASQVPTETDALSPESEIPEMTLEAELLEEVDPYLHSLPAPLSAQPSSYEDSQVYAWSRAMQEQLANMEDFSTKTSPAYESIRRQKQPTNADPALRDEPGMEAWTTVNAPRRKSSLTHLRRRQSFDVNASEEMPAPRFRLPALRKRASTSELLLAKDPG